MEVKIGVQHAPREIVVETKKAADEVESAVTAALSGDVKVLTLVDEHDRKVLVPSDRVAYVELGEPTGRKVGFGTI
ncbi:MULTISPECIES: DUF3107 domain-containing protein [Streptomyces]|uniref:DUF3107 domain-containing protein n=1 Tax=Streptomyces TaxID=1883 RepID=UPI0002FD0C39|nr:MULTISPECIES: DUF3107 domain-containing protein [Streptomyces]